MASGHVNRACGYRAIPLSVIVYAILEFILGMPDEKIG
jgi:hypothetical protein